MAKTFITERDVEALHAQGRASIEVTDQVVITDLAVERAMKLGMQIQRKQSAPPAVTFSPSVNMAASGILQEEHAAPDGELVARVKAAVLARLDGQVDGALLDAVVRRVVAGTQ